MSIEMSHERFARSNVERIPPDGREWPLPLGDARTRSLRSAGVSAVGIREVAPGFEQRDPAADHLVLGTVEGAGTLEVQDRSMTLERGDLVLAPAGIARRYAAAGGRWKFLAVRLDRERWRRLRDCGVHTLARQWLRSLVAPVEGMLAEQELGEASGHGQLPGLNGASPLQRALSQYADRLGPADQEERVQVMQPDALRFYALILKRQVERMLADLEAQQPRDDEMALASLWAAVRERPGLAWDTGQLATTLGVSRTTLYRMVGRRHGTSPARVVEALRMEEACRLLTGSARPLGIIAEQVGYANAFSFSAAFKRIVGEPPASFRRKVAQTRRPAAFCASAPVEL